MPPTSGLTNQQLIQLVQKQSLVSNVPAPLVLAIVEVESGGNPNAVGASGSIGLMQLKPSTAKLYGITNLTDPYSNLNAGIHYLHDLIARYHGDLHLAVAAYNVGPAAVTAADGVPPRAQHFVDKVFAAYARYQAAK